MSAGDETSEAPRWRVEKEREPSDLDQLLPWKCWRVDAKAQTKHSSASQVAASFYAHRQAIQSSTAARLPVVSSPKQRNEVVSS